MRALVLIVGSAIEKMFSYCVLYYVRTTTVIVPVQDIISQYLLISINQSLFVTNGKYRVTLV